MGKYKFLRNYLKKFKNKNACHVLKDCSVVIEGDSFIRQQYQEIGLNSIYGGEFDRYAHHLKTLLNVFIENNVTCYVVFTGAMDVDINKRKEIYQGIVNQRDEIKPNDREGCYSPIFRNDVQKQVLEELGIWYCVTEYATRQTLLDLSRELNCPVLTYNYEQCLLGMTCLTPMPRQSMNSEFQYLLQTPDRFNEHIRIRDEMKPLFFTLLDQNLSLFNKIPEIICSSNENIVGSLLYWIRKQNSDSLESLLNKLQEMLATTVEKEQFRASINELTNMIFCKNESIALRYLRSEQSELLNNEEDHFEKGILTGTIPNIYIKVKDKFVFSGSWAIFEASRRDAMLPTLDIVMYTQSLLCDKPQCLNFIGREGRSVELTIIPPKYPGISKDGKKDEGDFKTFIKDTVPGFDWSLLQPIPEDCWMLLAGLVYYFSKAETDFTAEAYSILLSYVMLGPVSEKVGLIRKDMIDSRNLDSGDNNDGICTYQDCLTAAKVIIDYFDEGDMEKTKKTFDRGVLHGLAEFQHCLQHLNYLNKLCRNGKVKTTNYFKTYNGTFVFNILLQLKEYEDPMLFIESNFNVSPSVLNFYKSIKEVFIMLLSATNLVHMTP